MSITSKKAPKITNTKLYLRRPDIDMVCNSEAVSPRDNLAMTGKKAPINQGLNIQFFLQGTDGKLGPSVTKAVPQN
jgi:hypothetical protein